MAKDEKKVLSKEESLELLRSRKDMKTWNEWAEAHPGVGVDFSGHDFSKEYISFEGFKFPGPANFSRAKFRFANFCGAKFSGGDAYFIDSDFSGGNADFFGAKFSGGDANFMGADFSGGNANFIGANFSEGGANFFGVEFKNLSFFRDATFEYLSSFEGAKFSGPVDLERSRFAEVPDFRRSTMAVHFTCHNMKVGYTTHPEKVWGIFKKASTDSDTDKFRRLKELAVQARDHEREQDFFAKELKAKRFYETTGSALIPSYFYECTSDFGRSLWRPFICLGLIWLIFGLLYGLNGLPYATSALDPLWNGLKLSLATLVPFAAISRTAMLEAREALFRSDVNHLLDFAMVVEGVLAVIFIFLIGLALRNRFRI